MTQEEKQLLAVLCAMFPYGVKVRINTKNNYYNAIVCEITRNYICVEGGGETCFSHGTYKPYLRSMSSMTENERNEYKNLIRGIVVKDYIPLPHINQVDWLNKHYFDYRGLLEKGLALEAPKDMYNTKTE